MGKKFIPLGLVLLLACGIFLCGCTAPQPPAYINQTNLTPAPPANITPVSPANGTNGTSAAPFNASSVPEANNRFAFDLYSQYKNDEGNLFFSPYSISSALAMTYEGAKGKTADEIASVFHFPNDTAAMRSGFKGVNGYLNQPGKNYALRSANALWAEQSYKFSDAYLNTTETYYGGKATNMDFIGDPDGSRITINNWVENQTNDKIKDLISQGLITSDTRLVLTNAIYFKGTWVSQFDERGTKEGDFRASPGSSVKAEMMHSQNGFGYAENSELQILEMPYAGAIEQAPYGDAVSPGNISMFILLPKNNSISSLENSISSDRLSGWESQLEPQEVNVFLPKFKFETKYTMGDTLAKMGMPAAFDPLQADFSGMDGTRDLFVGAVIHQAFVDVNENGTEAAAATAVIMMAGAAPGPAPSVPEFRADHPFLFLIQDKETGTILFMGRVSDPTK